MKNEIKIIKQNLKDVIIENASQYFKDENENFIFNNANPETLLLACCLQEFYNIEEIRLLYKTKDKLYTLTGKEVIDFDPNGKAILK